MFNSSIYELCGFHTNDSELHWKCMLTAKCQLGAARWVMKGLPTQLVTSLKRLALAQQWANLKINTQATNTQTAIGEWAEKYDMWYARVKNQSAQAYTCTSSIILHVCLPLVIVLSKLLTFVFLIFLFYLQTANVSLLLPVNILSLADIQPCSQTWIYFPPLPRFSFPAMIISLSSLLCFFILSFQPVFTWINKCVSI